jgi:tripartite-type tricarboxylate transporter receptor subunit TctC
MFKNPGYDPLTDFIPVAQYLKSPYVLVVNNDMPVKNFKEFVDYTKARPGKLTYAVNGVGGAANLAGELLKKRFGVDMENVGYTNTPQAFLDVAAGHILIAVADVGTALPLIKSGQLHALVVTSATRIPTLPDVPTVNEAAGVNDFEAVSWHILIARKGTPQPIIDKLHDEMTKIMADPEISKKIADLGLLPHPVPSIDETRAYIKAEDEKWGNVIKELGLAGTL